MNSFTIRTCSFGFVSLLGFASSLAIRGSNTLAAEDGPTEQELQVTFTEKVLPFLKSNCIECHGPSKQEGKLELASYITATDVSKSHPTWGTVREKLRNKEMPPEDARHHPTTEERQAVIQWIDQLRAFDAHRNAGDPGRVLPRRLSNAEYNHSIRDLTGVDIRPTDKFPVDPANESGFDNTGESLSMTATLLTKYLAAARNVAEHVVLKPNGFDFAAFPVLTDPDRDKYCVRRIIDFYQRQPIDLADYFQAAWQFKHRTKLGKGSASLEEVAAAARVSPKYLATVWSLLIDQHDDFGPIARVRALWNELPSPAIDPATLDAKALRFGCEQLRNYILELRPKLQPEFENLRVRGMHSGSQTLVTWKDRQYATHRRALNRDALKFAENELEIVVLQGAEAKEIASNPELIIPFDENLKKKHLSALERFCSVFPNAFFVSERGRVYLNQNEREKQAEKGRLLSAGFHSMMGYFRDDIPLYDMILDSSGQQELDRLWKELDFVTAAPVRQHTGFVWFERTDSRFMISQEFDFARAEDKDVTSEAKIKQLADVYLAKAIASGGEGAALDAIRDFFKGVNANVRWVEEARMSAEPSHDAALVDFAQRAFRRPLADDEKDELIRFFRQMRNQDGASQEDAVRDTLTSILMSPHFCFRIDVPNGFGPVVPLSEHSLASRLSYFLWASQPDQELLAHASKGNLHEPNLLIAQARRMVQDERFRGLATEFGGNWLDFRRFEEHNSVDRERFKSFDNDLRQSMFEEPIQFIVDLARRNGSILDLLYAKHTFVNAPLARHYGLPTPKANQWDRVENANEVERGGLLPMSVFLTANSPGLRTSPVKRGYWVVRRLLGETIPAPPPDVPVIPDNEEKLGKLTLRETLALHRENKNCAVCHDRFDSIGLVFEGFGPIGERRTKDLGDRPVDVHATFPNGSVGSGLEGLKSYLREQRQDDFIDNLCRKLLSYALSRSLQLSDDELIATMRAKLIEDEYRIGSLMETIITSRQFLMMRGTSSIDEVATK